MTTEHAAARRRANDLASWQQRAEASASCRTLRPWSAVMIDGSRLELMATSRAHAIASAQELCPRGRLVRVVDGGDW